jgi:hypothetical protein
MITVNRSVLAALAVASLAVTASSQQLKPTGRTALRGADGGVITLNGIKDSIDFEGLAAGTILSQVFTVGGLGPVTVLGTSPGFPGMNAAVIFDSSNPTGGDFDLGTPNEDFGGPGIGSGGELGSPYQNDTPRGNLIIVAEDLVDANGDDLVDDPDDADLVGSMISFDFNAIGPVTLDRLTLVDVEGKELAATVSFYDGDYFQIGSTVTLEHVLDNGLDALPLLSLPGVLSMVVVLNGSGAIDEIAFTVDDNDSDGCTPGYWKQTQHFDSWPAKYTPNQQFSEVFEDAFPGQTLLDVLGQGGGGLNALGRHTVAALLNATSAGSSFDYPLEEDDVIDLFNDLFPGSKADYLALKNIFQDANEAGCPLN